MRRNLERLANAGAPLRLAQALHTCMRDESSELLPSLCEECIVHPSRSLLLDSFAFGFWEIAIEWKKHRVEEEETATHLNTGIRRLTRDDLRHCDHQ